MNSQAIINLQPLKQHIIVIFKQNAQFYGFYLSSAHVFFNGDLRTRKALVKKKKKKGNFYTMNHILKPADKMVNKIHAKKSATVLSIIGL